MFLPCAMQVLCTAWYIQVNLFKIVVPFISGVNRQKEYRLSLAWILTSRYQSIVDDRMKIKCTSYMVNMLEESALNYHVVLQWRIKKVASWMSLKSSEINNYSWNISAVLISPFCSSSCSHACFPTIIRPTLRLWKMILKIVLNSPELNRSVFFSLYCFRVSKKMDYFLRNLVRRERRISWFNINPLSFIHRNDVRWIINRFSPLRFCFCLSSGCKNLQLWRLFFRQIFRTFCVVVVWINHKFIWSMRNSDPRMRIVLTQRPDSNFNSIFEVFKGSAGISVLLWFESITYLFVP